MEDYLKKIERNSREISLELEKEIPNLNTIQALNREIFRLTLAGRTTEQVMEVIA